MGKAAIYIVVAGVGCLVLVGVIGIIAAIAIPSLLRARVSANEAGAIGDIRTVISAEAAYASANGGYYDRIECLVQPATCIPGYSGPYMLDATFGTTPRGYRRTFHAGPAADSQALSSGKISPSSLTAFAYTAVPIQPNQTGVRSFCGDSRGIVCYALGGGPEVVNGECASACQPIN